MIPWRLLTSSNLGLARRMNQMRSLAALTVERSVFLSSLNYAKGQMFYRLGINRHRSGGTHAELDLEQSVAYIAQVVSDYLEYAGVPAQHLAGKDVLEVGPGDNLGVALSIVAKGARSVTCLDRFDPRRDERRNARIYQRIVDRLAEEERRRLNDVIRWDGQVVTLAPERIAVRYGCSIERTVDDMGERKFDIILSRAVLEHVADLESAWAAMIRALKTTGEMWHKIDFRNHRKYEQFHPLYFLTFGDAFWNVVTSPDPTLNRERWPAYRKLAERAFCSNRYYITRVLQHEELRPHRERLQFGRDYGETELETVARIRPRLHPRFRALADQDLLVSGLFLICRDLRDETERGQPEERMRR